MLSHKGMSMYAEIDVKREFEIQAKPFWQTWDMFDAAVEHCSCLCNGIWEVGHTYHGDPIRHQPTKLSSFPEFTGLTLQQERRMCEIDDESQEEEALIQKRGELDQHNITQLMSYVQLPCHQLNIAHQLMWAMFSWTSAALPSADELCSAEHQLMMSYVQLISWVMLWSPTCLSTVFGNKSVQGCRQSVGAIPSTKIQVRTIFSEPWYEWYWLRGLIWNYHVTYLYHLDGIKTRESFTCIQFDAKVYQGKELQAFQMHWEHATQQTIPSTNLLSSHFTSWDLWKQLMLKAWEIVG